MNILFVNPPNHRLDTDDLAPPLGLLVLMEALKDVGVSVSLLDLNLDSCTDGIEDGENFYYATARRITSSDYQMVCFTSMGLNTHVSLLLAQQIKALRPRTITIFGGPHCSAIGSELMTRFPWVDHVIEREGETALITLVLRLAGASASYLREALQGLAFQVRRHPWKAYSSFNLGSYFAANERHVLDFETGRGCKYKCLFCYSPSFWARRLDFDPASVAEDFERASSLGAKHLFIVQDNLLNNRDAVSSLCRTLVSNKKRLPWNCYATLLDIHDDTPEILSSAGCVSTYIGIDAITARQKRALGKYFTQSQDQCLEKIRMLVKSAIVPTCSLILDPANFEHNDFEESLRWAVTLRAEGAELSFHILTTYAATGLSRIQRQITLVPDEFRTRLMFDCPEVVANNPLAQKHVGLFPFHSRLAGDSEIYRERVAVVHLAQHLITLFPNEFTDLLGSEGVSLTELLIKLARQLAIASMDAPEPLAVKEAAEAAFQEVLCKDFGFVQI